MVGWIVVGEPAEGPDPRRFALVGSIATAIDFGLAVGLAAPVELVGRNVLRRASALARQRVSDGVVLCAHGSAVHHERWLAFVSGIGDRLLEASFAAVDHAWIGHSVGMSPQPLTPPSEIHTRGPGCSASHSRAGTSTMLPPPGGSRSPAPAP